MAHILIIEDDADIRKVTELILAEAQHSVISANDGLRGIELAVRTQPDLILMDLAMPRLDGWNATLRLKADTATNHIPIIAFTALMTSSAAKQALVAGCEAVITKPFDVDTLLDIITSLLAKHAQTDRRSTPEREGDISCE